MVGDKPNSEIQNLLIGRNINECPIFALIICFHFLADFLYLALSSGFSFKHVNSLRKKKRLGGRGCESVQESVFFCRIMIPEPSSLRVRASRVHSFLNIVSVIFFNTVFKIITVFEQVCTSRI